LHFEWSQRFENLTALLNLASKRGLEGVYSSVSMNFHRLFKQHEIERGIQCLHEFISQFDFYLCSVKSYFLS
jgi:hypothetical protein